MAAAAPVPTCVFCSPKDPFLLSFPTSSSNFYNLVFPLLLAPFWLLPLQRMNGCAAENCLTQHTATQHEKGKPNKKPKTKQKNPKTNRKPKQSGKTNKQKKTKPLKNKRQETEVLHIFLSQHILTILQTSVSKSWLLSVFSSTNTGCFSSRAVVWTSDFANGAGPRLL